jgi:hypothetical protein
MLVHEWIGHKELRFFYPIAAATPAYLALALAPLSERWRPRLPGRLASRLGGPLLASLELYQLVALATLTLTPASRKVAFESLVQAQIPFRAERFTLFYEGLDPYEQHGTPMHFYRDPALVVRPLAARQKNNTPYWLASSLATTPPAGCGALGSSLPDWVVGLPKSSAPWPGVLRSLAARLQRWTLFRCQG